MANFSDNFIGTLFGKGKEKKEGAEVTQAQKAEPVEAVIPQENNNGADEDGELIAVITAALISCLGGKSNIVVRNIRRVDDLTPTWGKASRTEQMAHRF